MVERDKRVHPTWKKLQKLRERLRDQIVSSDTTDEELVATMKEAIKVMDQGIAYELDLFAWDDGDEGHFKTIEEFEELKRRVEGNLRRKLERMANPAPEPTPEEKKASAARARHQTRRWVAAGKPTPPVSPRHIKIERIHLSP